MKKVVLMCRVSSDEQAKGYSLDVQQEQLVEYCQRNEIEVLDIIREDHSAKDFNRPRFQEFMQKARLAKKGRLQEWYGIDGLLFTTWDRFSRNIRAALNVIDELDKMGIKLFAIQQPFDTNIPESLVVSTLFLAIPEAENRRRSIKIREGMQKAQKSGRWCRVAPRGYQNTRDEDNKPIIVPGQTAPLVRRAFELASKGQSQKEIRKELNNKGLNLSRNGLSQMLRNPVYIGKIQTGNIGSSNQNTIFEGLHNGIVNENLFYKVQDVLSGRRRRIIQSVNSKHRDELPLRGNLLCSNCGEKLTGSASKSHTGRRYHYYHCNYCKKDRIRATYANDLISGILGGFKFKKEVKELYQEILFSHLTKDREEHKESDKVIQGKIIQLEGKLEKLQDLLTEGKMEYSEYAEISQRYRLSLSELKGKLIAEKDDQVEIRTKLKKAVNLLSGIGEFYKKADSKGKQQIISSIFPENLSILKNQCRTQRINEVLLRLLVIDKNIRKNKTGYFKENLKISRLVDLKGFEPLIF